MLYYAPPESPDLTDRRRRPVPTFAALRAVKFAISHLGGPIYTRRDATRVLLGYADLTSADGTRRPGPLCRPERWRQSFAIKLAMAIRGVL